MVDSGQSGSTPSHPLTLKLGAEQLVVRRRYEVASMLNDVLIGLWFVVGSCFFLYSSLQETGTWLFLIGSIQLLIRPMIRIAKDVHLRRSPDGSWDF
jgi:YrhK-like protein